MFYTCLIFSEGGRDYKFLNNLIDLDKFKYHTKKWNFSTDHASGVSPDIILKQCHQRSSGVSFDLILCFIDLDALKVQYPNNWHDKKKELSVTYNPIQIIWQINNIEDEFKKVLGTNIIGKHKLNKKAQKLVKKFINSDFWNRIIIPIKNKEKELDAIYN